MARERMSRDQYNTAHDNLDQARYRLRISRGGCLTCGGQGGWSEGCCPDCLGEGIAGDTDAVTWLSALHRRWDRHGEPPPPVESF